MDANARFNLNLKLAHFWAHRFTMPYEYQDRFQVASMALFKACNAYVEGKVKFSTFASRVIKNDLLIEAKRCQVKVTRAIEGQEDYINFIETAKPRGLSLEDSQILASAIAGLTPEERDLLAHIVKENSLRIIGANLGLSHEGVRKRAFALGERMKALMGKYGVRFNASDCADYFNAQI